MKNPHFPAGKKGILLFLLATLSIPFILPHTASTAHACSCRMPSPPLESLRQSDYVFAGVAEDIVFDSLNNDGTHISYGSKYVTFSVSSVWKGAPKNTLIVVTPVSGAQCGFGFQKGQEYIVYANEYNGKLRTSHCSRTKMLKRAQEDLQELGEGTIPKIDRTPDNEEKRGGGEEKTDDGGEKEEKRDGGEEKTDGGGEKTDDEESMEESVGFAPVYLWFIFSGVMFGFISLCIGLLLGLLLGRAINSKS